MRLRCEFKTDKMPVSYQMQIVSLIKEALKKINTEYYEKIYKFEGDRLNKKTKNFTFGVFVKDYNLENDIFIVNDKVIINFSSPDYGFMVNLYNGIMEKKVFEYKDFKLENIKISMVQEKKVEKDEVIFSTVSPIVIRSREGKFLNIDDENYLKELNYIANLTIESYRGYGLKSELKVTPISIKKIVVKEEIRGFTDKTNKKYLFVNAYKGLFKIEGDKEDLNLIYQLGLGFRRGSGFGMLDVIG